jgi:hypothetical protein
VDSCPIPPDSAGIRRNDWIPAGIRRNDWIPAGILGAVRSTEEKEKKKKKKEKSLHLV